MEETREISARRISYQASGDNKKARLHWGVGLTARSGIAKAGSILHWLMTTSMIFIGLLPWIIYLVSQDDFKPFQFIIFLGLSIFCLDMGFWMVRDWYRLWTTVLVVDNKALRVSFRAMGFFKRLTSSLAIPLEDVLEISLTTGLERTGLNYHLLHVLFRMNGVDDPAGRDAPDNYGLAQKRKRYPGWRLRQVEITTALANHELKSVLGRLLDSRPGIRFTTDQKNFRDLKNPS